MIIIERQSQKRWEVTVRSAKREVFTKETHSEMGGRIEKKYSVKHQDSNVKRVLRHMLNNYDHEYSLVTASSFLN
jgi:hypothetical protein